MKLHFYNNITMVSLDKSQAVKTATGVSHFEYQKDNFCLMVGMLVYDSLNSSSVSCSCVNLCDRSPL